MSPDLEELAIESEAVAGIFDELDYFQILKIPPSADRMEVKSAYYRESRRYHPDRVFHVDDPVLKTRILRIYKRITEAYSVLRDESRRAKYLVDITGPQREQKLRYDHESEQELKKAREDEIGTTPNGRKLYAAALADLQAGRYDAAERGFRMALIYEPQNARYREKAEEAARERSAAAAS